jgi:beta-galactosidase
VEVWEREVPAGAGITGLWRPIPDTTAAANPFAALAGDDNSIFTLRQNGGSLEGIVEGGGGGVFGGSDGGAKIEEGKVDGSSVSFKAGASSYSGTIKNDRIELKRTTAPRFPAPHVAEASGPRPAIGPPPDGSDPSRNPNMRIAPTTPLVLNRVQR